MIKKLLAIMLAALVFAACDSQQEKDAPEKPAETIEIELVNFFDGTELNAEDEVWVTGNVVHTCKHSGKKMFIVDDEGENKLRIDAGGNVAEFETSLEGSKVKVKGIIEEEKVDENYLKEWESELMAEGDSDAIGEGDCAEEQPEEYDEEKTMKENQMNRIKELRKQIAESEKGYLSFYSLKAIEYEKVN